MPFELTEKAAEQVKSIQAKENKAGWCLKIGVVGGGCSGLSYKLDFTETPTEGEKAYDCKGVRLTLDPKSLLFVKGTILDFSDGLNGQGFVFNNPNAKTSCGCGSSFSA
ncbi:iron-sulfur cluster assembly accessory protein [bacterium]|nr:iron-sulfur cluster assembly accessory protein [bacterium]